MLGCWVFPILSSVCWAVFLPCQLPGCLSGDCLLDWFPLDGVPPQSGSGHHVSVSGVENNGLCAPLVRDVIKVFLYRVMW